MFKWKSALHAAFACALLSVTSSISLSARIQQPPDRPASRLERVAFRVNGQLREEQNILHLSDKGKDVVLVPIRTVMEAIGWTVIYTSAAEAKKSNLPGADVRVLAPYQLEYQHEDLEDTLRGKKDNPGFLISLRDGYTLVFSPQWSMGENLSARPLPCMVEGRLYVPLTLLEDAVAQLVLRLGQLIGDPGLLYPSKTGVMMLLEAPAISNVASKKGELRVLYLPSAVESDEMRSQGKSAGYKEMRGE